MTLSANKIKSPLLHLLALTFLLSGCATAASNCPAYPPAGKAVAEELIKMCYHQNVNNCPAIFEWLERIERLRLQLEACT